MPCGSGRFSFARTLIMGIVNVTPDSFSDGGRYDAVDKAAAHALRLAREGADILDIGGESTRPGADTVSQAAEIDRVVPVIERLVAEGASIPISIDTRKAAVAEAALDAGASMVNDVTGLGDPAMIDLVARHDVPAVIMHMRGTPETMQQTPRYGDVVGEIDRFFKERIALARAGGATRLIVDPGVGFGKTLEHNLELLRRLRAFHYEGIPLLVGASRKRFIGDLTDEPDPLKREEGTIAATALAIAGGADIVRVHDVAANRKAARVADALIQ